MKTKYYLFLFLLTCFSFSVVAQGGFFGKKTVISIDGSLRGTLIYNRVLPDFDYNSGTKNGKASSHFIATGFSASLSHYFSKTIGIGIDFNMGFNYIKTPNGFWTSYYSYNYEDQINSETTLEKLRMKTIYIIPKFEWSSNGNLPVGFSQSIGIGYAGSSIVDRTYKKTETHLDYTGNQATTYTSTVKGSSIAPIHGMVVEYGFKIRFPITSFMTLNLGSNLRVHLPGFRYMISGSNTTTLDGQIERSMRNSRGANLMDIRAGLAFVLF